jgi:hypothetical protein
MGYYSTTTCLGGFRVRTMGDRGLGAVRPNPEKKAPYLAARAHSRSKEISLIGRRRNNSRSLTEAANELASGLRRACDLIEERGRRENFYLDVAGGLSGRAAGAVFHNAHLPYELSRANRAEKDALAIEFSEYLDSAGDKAKDIVRRVSLFEEDFPFSQVLATHCGCLSINASAPARRCARDSFCIITPATGSRRRLSRGAAEPKTNPQDPV